ncbi:MAG: hypothetical protein Athens071416_455 [Parcubacteria group bacterium Athens0714_16]|nr:MAG: hypothetical protein Athens071416_455 [Parcubacteria group bacterium Athens0714_16]
MEKILIITSKPDLHADYLEEKLNKQKIQFVRFNADELANRFLVTYTENGGHVILETKDGKKCELFKPNEITAIWYRKPFLTKFDRIKQNINVAFAGRETDAYLQDLCLSLFESGCKWINHPESNRVADNKIFQLRLAQQLGLHVPKTIVTNNTEEVLDFYKHIEPKQLIYKTLSHPFISETAETFRSVFTSHLEISQQTMESIKFAPCLIQEQIDKDHELRITVIGDRLFTARIFSQDTLSTTIDWRRDQHKIKLRQELATLDPNIERLCFQLLKQLNLIFGTIDMIVTPTGEHVFLEVNPNGQWLWIETILGAPISDALITELV